MIRSIILTALVCSLVLEIGFGFHPAYSYADAQNDWKTEFEDICSKTDGAITQSKTEVKSLIDRCDALKPRIEKLEPSLAKVYMKRLQMCRDLLVFVLASTPDNK